MAQTQSTNLQFTWEDMEEALADFANPSAHPEMLPHLIRALKTEATEATPAELLSEAFRSVLLISRPGASATAPRPQAGTPVSA